MEQKAAGKKRGRDADAPQEPLRTKRRRRHLGHVKTRLFSGVHSIPRNIVSLCREHRVAGTPFAELADKCAFFYAGLGISGAFIERCYRKWVRERTKGMTDDQIFQGVVTSTADERLDPMVMSKSACSNPRCICARSSVLFPLDGGTEADLLERSREGEPQLGHSIDEDFAAARRLHLAGQDKPGSQKRKQKLTLFDKYRVCYLRIDHNMTFNELAERFRCHESYCRKVVRIYFQRVDAGVAEWDLFRRRGHDMERSKDWKTSGQVNVAYMLSETARFPRPRATSARRRLHPSSVVYSAHCTIPSNVAALCVEHATKGTPFKLLRTKAQFHSAVGDASHLDLPAGRLLVTAAFLERLYRKWVRESLVGMSNEQMFNIPSPVQLTARELLDKGMQLGGGGCKHLCCTFEVSRRIIGPDSVLEDLQYRAQEGLVTLGSSFEEDFYLACGLNRRTARKCTSQYMDIDVIHSYFNKYKIAYLRCDQNLSYNRIASLMGCGEQYPCKVYYHYLRRVASGVPEWRAMEGFRGSFRPSRPQINRLYLRIEMMQRGQTYGFRDNGIAGVGNNNTNHNDNGNNSNSNGNKIPSSSGTNNSHNHTHSSQNVGVTERAVTSPSRSPSVSDVWLMKNRAYLLAQRHKRTTLFHNQDEPQLMAPLMAFQVSGLRPVVSEAVDTQTDRPLMFQMVPGRPYPHAVMQDASTGMLSTSSHHMQHQQHHHQVQQATAQHTHPAQTQQHTQPPPPQTQLQLQQQSPPQTQPPAHRPPQTQPPAHRPPQTQPQTQSRPPLRSPGVSACGEDPGIQGSAVHHAVLAKHIGSDGGGGLE